MLSNNIKQDILYKYKGNKSQSLADQMPKGISRHS